jgi:hypothetical protein
MERKKCLKVNLCVHSKGERLLNSRLLSGPQGAENSEIPAVAFPVVQIQELQTQPNIKSEHTDPTQNQRGTQIAKLS